MSKQRTPKHDNVMQRLQWHQVFLHCSLTQRFEPKALLSSAPGRCPASPAKRVGGDAHDSPQRRKDVCDNTDVTINQQPSLQCCNKFNEHTCIMQLRSNTCEHHCGIALGSHLTCDGVTNDTATRATIMQALRTSLACVLSVASCKQQKSMHPWATMATLKP
jgi:hypothetical protein